jgi:hypothetical protein
MSTARRAFVLVLLAGAIASGVLFGIWLFDAATT